MNIYSVRYIYSWSVINEVAIILNRAHSIVYQNAKTEGATGSARGKGEGEGRKWRDSAGAVFEFSFFVSFVICTFTGAAQVSHNKLCTYTLRYMYIIIKISRRDCRECHLIVVVEYRIN